MKARREKWLSIATMALAGVLGSAHKAQAAVFGDWLYNLQENFMEPLREVFIYGCGVAGIIMVALGLYNIYEKSKPHSQSQTSGGAIAALIVVGGLFLVIAYVAATATETVTGAPPPAHW